MTKIFFNFLIGVFLNFFSLLYGVEEAKLTPDYLVQDDEESEVEVEPEFSPPQTMWDAINIFVASCRAQDFDRAHFIAQNYQNFFVITHDIYYFIIKTAVQQKWSDILNAYLATQQSINIIFQKACLENDLDVVNSFLGIFFNKNFPPPDSTTLNQCLKLSIQLFNTDLMTRLLNIIAGDDRTRSLPDQSTIDYYFSEAEQTAHKTSNADLILPFLKQPVNTLSRAFLPSPTLLKKIYEDNKKIKNSVIAQKIASVIKNYISDRSTSSLES